MSGPGADTDNFERPLPQPIKGGSGAADYPEAVLINLQSAKGNGSCSGSLIAPTLVLTAGHCLTDFGQAEVVAPYASPQQSAMGYKAAVLDYTDTGGSVNPNQHDVGVIFLSQPIQLTHYLQLDPNAVTIGTTQANNIGRINNGQLSQTDLFIGPTITLGDGNPVGFPYAYYSNEITEPGDSGGPVVLPGPAPRTVVAVCSGGGNGSQLMARLDQVHDWLQQQLAIAGGGGSGSSTGSGATTGSGASTSAQSSTSAGVGGSSPTSGSGGGKPTSGAGGGCGSCTGGGGYGSGGICHDVCQVGPPMKPSWWRCGITSSRALSHILYKNKCWAIFVIIMHAGHVLQHK